MKIIIQVIALVFLINASYSQLPPIFGDKYSDRASSSDMVKTYLTPKRIVWQSDDTGETVQNVETLLKRGSGQVAVNDKNLFRFISSADKKPGILLDYGKEIHGGVKISMGIRESKTTEQLVYNIANRRPKSLSKLDGTLEVVSNSSHEERLDHLKDAITDLSWKSNNELESEELLQMVSDDIIEYTIADSNELLLNQRFLINLRVAFDISEPQSLAWALPKTADKSLFREVQKFFKKIKENGELTRLIERNYGHVENFDYVGTMIFMRHIETRLPAYQDFFEQAAEQYDVDWRLIAAMGYQESHWDPDAVSPTGVRGIMMLTLKTAKDMGIKNRLDPESSISGGAKYFKKTLERIDKDITEPDNFWMAMAAYNVGFYHLKDARKITRKLNKDPNRWIDVKESLPLLAKRKWYKQTRYGYARGWEPVRYVENIRSYYDILKWVDDGSIETTPVPEEFLMIPKSL